MKYYGYSKKNGLKSDTKTFIITTICVIIIMITNSIKDTSIIKDTITITVNNVKQFMVSIINTVCSITIYGNEKDIMYKENQSLKDENAILLNNLVDYYKISAENDELRNYFGIKEEISTATLVNATVISKNNTYNFILNKGIRNGIKCGDIVLTKNGLVGFISEVSYSTATVQTILSPLTKVAIKNITSNKMGVMNGDLTLSKNGNTKLIYTKTKDDFNIGDIITTSGIGDVYPENIKIGKVIDICYDKYDTSVYAVVDLYEDIATVDKVAIITGF